MTDPISDMLTRIRNANRALLPGIEVPHSKIKESIASILKKEGYINDFAVEGKTAKTIKVKLKYQGKKSIIEGLRRVSTPGLRRYVGSTEIPRVRGGLGVAVVSTSEGAGHDALRRLHVGGRHDRRPGTQKEYRRRVALLRLVRRILYVSNW